MVRINPFVAAWRCVPYILVAGVVGLCIYNPSGYSLVDLIRVVFTENAGDLEGVVWYLQPTKIAMILIILAIAVIAYFNWEIARSEKTFLIAFIVSLVLLNMLILGFASAIGYELFTWKWVEWQIVPILFMALTFAATLPRVRRAYTGTVTGGGGEIDIEHDDHHHDDDDQHD